MIENKEVFCKDCRHFNNKNKPICNLNRKATKEDNTCDKWGDSKRCPNCDSKRYNVVHGGYYCVGCLKEFDKRHKELRPIF